MKFNRRECLEGIGRGVALTVAAGSAFRGVAAQFDSKTAPGRLAMPGPYRGRVVAVQSQGVLASGQY